MDIKNIVHHLSPQDEAANRSIQRAFVFVPFRTRTSAFNDSDREGLVLGSSGRARDDREMVQVTRHSRPRLAPRLLRHVQSPPIAAGAHESAGHLACVLAAFEDGNTGDKRCFISIDTLYEAPTAGGHVMDKLRLMQPQ
jgi:hypothetical protein